MSDAVAVKQILADARQQRVVECRGPLDEVSRQRDLRRCAGVSCGRFCQIAVETAPNTVDRATRKLHRILHHFATLRS